MAQQVVGADPAGDLAEGVMCQTQFLGGQFQMLVPEMRTSPLGVLRRPL